MTDDELRAIYLQTVLEDVKSGPCILCGASTAATCAWPVDDPQIAELFGVPANEKRVFFFAVCAEHEPEPDGAGPIFQLIKMKLIAKYQVQ